MDDDDVSTVAHIVNHTASNPADVCSNPFLFFTGIDIKDRQPPSHLVGLFRDGCKEPRSPFHFVTPLWHNLARLGRGGPAD